MSYCAASTEVPVLARHAFTYPACCLHALALAHMSNDLVCKAFSSRAETSPKLLHKPALAGSHREEKMSSHLLTRQGLFLFVRIIREKQSSQPRRKSKLLATENFTKGLLCRRRQSSMELKKKERKGCSEKRPSLSAKWSVSR